MHRPTFLIAEPEPPEGLSARKLVLETAKFNVITAYSIPEAMASFERFPDIDALILHSRLDSDGCAKVIESVRQARPQMPIVLLSPTSSHDCQGADVELDSHEPEKLLSLLRSRFGDPRTKFYG